MDLNNSSVHQFILFPSNDFDPLFFPAGRKSNAHPSPSTPRSCVPVRRLQKGSLQCLGLILLFKHRFFRCSVCCGRLKLIAFYSLLLAINLQPRPQIYRNGVA